MAGDTKIAEVVYFDNQGFVCALIRTTHKIDRRAVGGFLNRAKSLSDAHVGDLEFLNFSKDGSGLQVLAVLTTHHGVAHKLFAAKVQQLFVGYRLAEGHWVIDRQPQDPDLRSALERKRRTGHA